MKKFAANDKLFGEIAIRQDGRVVHPMYLFEVKKPEESKYPYDYYKLISTIAADQAFRPLAEGGCSWSSEVGARLYPRRRSAARSMRWIVSISR